jgi:hypothetical protein
MRARDALEVTAFDAHEDPSAWAAATRCAPASPGRWSSDAKEPVAMGGALALWPGVVQTWLVATDALPRYAVTVMRTARDAHTRLAAAGVRRFQTWAMVGYDTAYRWLDPPRLHRSRAARRFGWAATAYDYDMMARIEGAPRG